MGDPRTRLLDGDAWQQAKTPALNGRPLAEEPRELLAAHAAALDEAWAADRGGLAAARRKALRSKARH